MGRWMRRNTWVIHVAFLGAVAVGAAVVAGRYAAGRIERGSRVTEVPPIPPAAGSEAPAPAALASQITARDLFRGEVASAPPSSEPRPPESAPGCVSSLGPLALVGTLVAYPRDLSMAVVRDATETDTRLFMEGQTLGDYRISSIERARVRLSGERGEACLALEAPPATAPPSTAPAPSQARETDGGVRAIGAGRYCVERSLVEATMENPTARGAGLHIIPRYEGGHPRGFKLTGVRLGGLAHRLGLRSGDVIRTVEGEEVTSPNKALELYARLQEASGVSLEVERRGQRVGLRYEISNGCGDFR